MGDKPVLPVLIGPLSGPVHGVSVINNALRARLAAEGVQPAIIDLSPGLRARGAAYHAARIGRTLLGAMRILEAALVGRRRRTIMHLDGGGGLVYNIALALVLRLTRQPVLFYHHSSRYVLADSWLIRLLMAVGGRAPQLFCSGKMARLFFDRYQPPGKTLIINNSAWVAPVPARQHRDHGRLRLGFLSALNLEKGIGRAIATLRALHGRGLAAELVVAGARNDPKTHDLLDRAKREFGGALIFRGVLQDRDKAAFLSELDYLLFPSLYPHETQSLVVPEALSAGVPVVAFDHRFVGEVLGDGGLLIASDQDFAARAADWIATDQPLSDRQKRARAQFEADRTRADGQVECLIAWSLGTA